MALFITLLSVSALAFAEETPPEPPDAELRSNVLQLIEKLGNDEFECREQAQKELAALGPKAALIVDKLPASADAEVNSRLQRFHLQCRLYAANSLPELLTLRQLFLTAENTELADAALKKAETLASPLELASALFERSMTDHRKVKPDITSRSATIALIQIETDLNLCIDYYDAHLKLHPDDKDAEDRMTEAAMINYACRKYSSL